ncbi:MAG: DUF6179 domain-containing protein [Lachnospiraceae bacterium]|nr:DUF6179 domain-containing protein [Robinsoniella sp.]MDY3766043.1 DUF6179 domain-containing protein [Lachnospiraceae bacterium]
MRYEMEELVPVVAELARKYTSGESTSITYERANQLMEAVLYCIHACESGNMPVSSVRLSAMEAYQLGYQKVFEKVSRTQEKYNEMICDFCAYGNENYYDTVTKALPAFFRHYNAQFAPQETIITIDYPTLRPIQNLTGIDAIEQYVEDLFLEQTFFNSFSREYVYHVLICFQETYQRQFYNLCRIVLRDILSCILIGKKVPETSQEEREKKLAQTVKNYSKEQLKVLLDDIIDQMIREKWSHLPELGRYLKSDTEDFAFELLLCLS